MSGSLGWPRDELLGKRTTDFQLWVDLDRDQLLADMAVTGISAIGQPRRAIGLACSTMSFYRSSQFSWAMCPACCR